MSVLVRRVISGSPARGHGHVACRAGCPQYVPAQCLAGCPAEMCVWKSAPRSEGSVLRVCGRRRNVGNVGKDSTLSTNHARACRVLVPCRPAPERAQGWSKVPRWHDAKKLWSRSTSCRRTTDLEITHFAPCTESHRSPAF